jgi:VCBS repeat-containing protein
MTVTPTTTLRVDFVSESAAYENVFGWYNKVTGMGGILFADVEQEGPHAPLVAGQSFTTFTVNSADLGNIQFFLISNGYNINKSDPGDLTGPVKVIQLSDGSWAVADVDANGNVVVDRNGKPDILHGAGANALFTETSKNAGGVDYASSVVGSSQTAGTLAGDTADGATGLIAWEDLAATRNRNGTYGNPGDADYNDAVFRISVVGAPPVANADAVSLSEDAGATTINVLGNDTDPDAGDVLKVTALNLTGVIGTVTIAAGGGSIVYTPSASFQLLRAGQTATETFSYTVADQAGHTASANVTVTIVGANDGPVAVNDAASATEAGGVNNGTPGVNPTGNVLTNDTDVDSGDTKTVSAVAGLAANVGAAVAGAYGSLTVNADGTYNYVLNNANGSVQALRQFSDTLTDSFTYTVKDSAGATSTAMLAVTIRGANDAPTAGNDFNAADPVVESGVNPGNTPFAGDGTATGNVLTNDTDVDAGDTKTVTTTGTFAGTFGSVTIAADGSYTYTLNNGLAATNALAQGEAAADVFSYTMRDAAGATSSATLTINVTGTNDKPVITGGATTGSVQEDTTTQATGQLFATDPDHGATKAWTVVGGTQSTAADYHFAADSFTITRNGVSVLQDDFSDGAPPPNSPPFGNGSATTYTGFGGFTESGGKVFLDSSIAQNPFNANPQDPVIGQNALARTNIDPANLTAGLKSNVAFTVEGVFDLILPDSPRESYGIRVIDRLINNPPQPTDQPGNDTIELVVRMNLAGQLTVALRRIDFGTNTVTQIESIPLNTALGADQIHLKFDHVANASTISASFEYLQNNVVVGTQSFGSTPEIFDGENWTRGDLVASAPLMTDSILDGNYGTLNVNQSGTWNYLLNNGKAATQALAQGEHQTETFQLKVTDQFGASDTRTVTIDVAGTNDAPIVSAPAVGGGAEGSGTATVNLLAFASDVDHGTVLHIENVVWDEVPAGMPAGFAVVGNSIQIDTNSLAYNALAQGETFVTHFTYNVVDEFGASVVQHATVTVTGTNDTPTVSAAVSGGGNEGSGTAIVDLLQGASDVDNGAVLHVENVSWDEGSGPGSLPAGFTLVGNSLQIDTNSAAYDALAQGETFTTHFTYNVVDEHGASTVQHAEVTITGTNDAPVISGTATGSIQEDTGPAFVSGTLTAADPDHGATKTWSLVGGTTAHTADYHVMVDEFRVTKNGSTYFDDTFSDGNPPPSITNIPDPSVFYSIRPGNLVTEADGYAVLDGINSLPPAFGTGANHNVKLFTNFDNNNTTLGLKKGDSFSVEGRFDLVALDMGDSYGIRLDDRVLPTGPSAPPQHPGDDGIQLMVTRSSLTGNVIVRLGEVDFVAATNTTLATTLLNAGLGDDQIVLKLTHDVSNPGVLTATYQLYDDGVATGSGSLSSPAARIFGTETPGDTSDDENWTQAVFESGDNRTNTQEQNGTYGSLSINQNGTWTYNVANTHANVQALAQGETVTDTFSVQVADQFGATDTETVNVTVTGTNDAPVIATGPTTGATEEDGNPLATGTLTATDVDHNAAITWSVVGGQQVNSDAIFALDEFKIIKNGGLLFDDQFNDGNPPPSAPNLNAGTPTQTGTSYAIPNGTTFIETLDHVIMYGPLGPAPAPGIGPGAPNFVSESATLLTNNDPAQGTSGLGLRIGTTFSVEGRFEGFVPEDAREGYGIRLTDRNTPATPTASNPFNPGNDVLELTVRRDANGNLAIQFRDLDIENNTTPVLLGSVAMTPAMIDGNQIVLQLNHATAGSQNITASFSIVDHDGNVVQPMTVIQNLANTGPAVGQAFNGELYTRAQFIGSDPVENVSYLHGQYGSLTIDQSGNWKYLLDNNSAAVQALAEGEVVTDTFTVRATDEHGAFDSKTINVTVTGDNDAPKITSAVTVGSVTEDGIVQATGTLTATDVDHNAIKTWNVTSVNTGNTGNAGHTTDYKVTIDEFKIVKNGVTIFDDTFTGTFPPTAPAGTTLTYIGTNGQFTGGVDGRAVMDDEHSGIGFSISNPALDFTGQPTGGIGNWAQISTNIDPANLTQGLKSGSSFSISGTYDLIHSEAGYGIRFANTNGAINFAGNDVVDFNVRTGGPFGPDALYLQLTQIDFTVPNGATTLQQLQLNPPAGADQILLTLTHDAATNGVVKASFSYLDDGVVVGGSTLGAEGHIFQHTNWVRGGFEATAPGNTSSFVNGVYGALAVNQSGTWTYNLANNQANVQALAQGQTVTDVFTVKVTDEHGASDMRTINVTVTGTNDVPTVSAALSGGGDEGTGVTSVDLLQNASDIDNFASLHIENVVWDEAPGNMPAGFTVAGTALQVDTNSPAYAGLNEGQSFSVHFTYNVVDEFGGSTVQHATVTINGVSTNAAPTVSAEVTGGGNEGSGTATVDLLQFASDADGDALHATGVTWDEVPGMMPAGFTLVGDSIQVDTNALAYDAMAQGETFVTHFTYTVEDGQGGSTVQHATVTITGTNDAPTVSAAVTGGGSEGTGRASVDLLQFASDVDHNASLHVENVVWDEVPAGMPAGFALAGNSIEVDTNALAYNAMAQGETFTTHFTYNVVDEFGGSTVQHATVTVTGTNDTPTVSAAATDVVNEGSGTQSVDLLQFASDADNGAVLHIENVIWAESPGNMPAGFTVVGNTIQVDTNSPAYDALAMSETYTTNFAYWVVDQFGASVQQFATITVLGTNDAPTVSAAVTGSGTEGTGTQSVDLLQFASDVDHDAALHIENVVWDEVPGNLPAGFTLVGNSIQVDTNSPAYDGLNTGESYTTHFTYDVVDSHGASVQQHATVTINGVTDAGPNQAPVIHVSSGTGLAPAANFNAGARPGHVAIGDVNSDGKADLVASNFHGQTTVSVLIGDGNGNFGAPTAFSSGGLSPSSVVLGDFNGDGKLDIATTNQDTASIGILLGNGAGSFGAPSTLFAQNPTSVTTGDFNEDGKLDLVVGQSLGNQVSLFLGNGNGTFGPAQGLTPGFQVMQTAVGDLNNDGNLDIVAAANSGTSQPRAVVMLGNGNGTFGAPTHYLSSNGAASAASIALGDFNGDGNLDIAQADTGNPGVSIMLGNGAGGFGARASYGTIMPANSTGDLVVGDFNGDGKQDLALGNTATNSATVMYGNGNGTFQPEVSFATGNTPTTITAGDVNGDGLADLITPNNFGSNVSVLLNRYASTTNEDTPLTLTGISVTDADAASDALSVSLAVGHGTLALANAAGLSGDVDGSDGVMSFTGSQAAINAALASGLTYAPTLNYNGADALNIVVNDQGHNGLGGPLSDSETIALTVNAVNDAPTVTGTDTGSVTEDSPRFLQARGNLFSTDPDGGSPSWSIVGGTTSASTQDFRFQADDLKITKGGVLFFQDTFGDNNPPSSAPNFANGTGASYTVNGNVTEAAGRIFFDGTQATTFGTTNYGERVMLNSNTNALPDNGGLKRNADFTTEARFDLVAPEDGGDAYGVRLIDQPAPPGTNDSAVDLVLLRDATGVHVALRQINVAASTNVVLQQLDLPAGTYDQIVFKLNYAASSYVNSTLGGKITASYDLLVGGVVTASASFTSQGTIFQGEDFTRVQLIGQSNQAETGVWKLAGTYGTLTIAQDGQWHYFLADQQANVQALDAGQQVFDNFTIRVSDGLGGFTDKAVSIAVNGANDGNASIGNPSAASVTEDLNVSGGNLTATGIIPITDPDGQNTFQTSVTPAGGTLGSLSLQSDGNYTYSVANSAVQFLGAGAIKTENFTVRSADGTSKVVSFTINGVNDAPVANPDVNTGAPVVEQGVVFNTPNPVFGNAWANGGVLQNDTDVDVGDVRSVAGVAAGSTNSVPTGNLNVSVAGTYGTLTMSANGGWGYHLEDSNPATDALAQGQVVQDVFSYTVSDGHGGTANSTLTINVTGSNDAPTASLPKHEMLEGSGVHQIDLLAGASDPEGNTFQVTGIDAPWSWLTLNPDGHTISIDTNDSSFNYMGMGTTQDTYFNYTLTDSLGASSLQLGTFRIVGTDDRPITAVDGQHMAIEAGGTDPGYPDPQMRLFAADVDWISGVGGGTPIVQSVYADTNGWTPSGNGLYSKTGTYGTLVWDTNFITTPDQQHYTTLTYHLDNNDPDTHNLRSSDNVYDNFDVTFTDGAVSTTRAVHFEVVGRSDMSDATATYRVLYPTDGGTWAAGALTTTDGPAVSFVSSGTTLNQITPSASLNFGNLIVLYNGADGSVNFSDEDIRFTFSNTWSAPDGFTDATVLRNGGGAHFGPPAGGDDWVVWYHIDGSAWDGIEITGLPTIERVDLAVGAQNVPFIGWTEHSFRVNFMGQTYQEGSQLDYVVTFRPGTPLYDYSVNGADPFTDVGATSQSIGSTVTVHDSFVFDLNVPYSGNVQFEGANGTLKFENTAFTGTVSNFSDGDHLDFSAITGGNATVSHETDGILAAHSIGWTTDGLDAFVYVNNTEVDEAIGAAQMIVKLLNVTQLNSHDFIV